MHVTFRRVFCTMVLHSYNALDYFKLFWPDALTSLIGNETKRYARQKVCSNWVDVTTDELWTSFGIIITMGIHGLPTIRDY